MKQNTLKKILALGTATGIRSMAGVATLSLASESVTGRIMPALALGEMVLDKTPFAGDRVDALLLAGRALMGALTGGFIAREQRDNVVLGGLLGAQAQSWQHTSLIMSANGCRCRVLVVVWSKTASS
jgi:uncharacterized membrane protein